MDRECNAVCTRCDIDKCCSCMCCSQKLGGCGRAGASRVHSVRCFHDPLPPPLIRGAINVPLHPHQTNVFLKLLACLGPTDLCCGQLAHLIERRQLEAMPRRMAPSVRCSSKQCERPSRVTRCNATHQVETHTKKPCSSHALHTRNAIRARPRRRAAARVFIILRKSCKYFQHAAAATGDNRGAGQEGKGGYYKRDFARWNVGVASYFHSELAVMRLRWCVSTSEGTSGLQHVFDLENTHNFKSVRAISARPETVHAALTCYAQQLTHHMSSVITSH